MLFGRRAVVALLIALGTVAVFLPVLDNGFVSVDDSAYVTGNPMVQSGLNAAALRWSWSASVSGHWHPLTLWSHMLDATLFGPNPRGHHLTSLLLHGLNAALVFLLFCSLTGAAWRSAALALLWAVHPLRVESVAWVAERKDVLSGVFFLLTLLAYVAWTRSRSRVTYALCVALFAAGLMAKSMLVTLPGVLLLLDTWPLGRFPDVSAKTIRARLLEKAPFFILAFASAVLTVHFQAVALASTESFPLGGRIANAVLGSVQYLRATVWPRGLAALYPIPETLPWIAFAASAAVLALLSWVAWRSRERAPYLAIGWLWFLGVLFPVLGLVQAGPQAWADRFSYLPALGLLLALVWAAAEWARPRLGSFGWRIALGAVLVLTLWAEAAATGRQIPVWRNDITLWRHAIEVTPPNYFAEVNLAGAWLRMQRPEVALPHFREAARLAPDSTEARAGYGEVLRQTGQPVAAVEELRRAVALRPDDAGVRVALAAALVDVGDRDGAAEELLAALRLAPDSPAALSGLRELGFAPEAR